MVGKEAMGKVDALEAKIKKLAEEANSKTQRNNQHYNQHDQRRRPETQTILTLWKIDEIKTVTRIEKFEDQPN